MVKDEEIVGIFYAEIEFTRVSLCQGRANLRQITIRDYENIENLSELMVCIERMSTGTGVKTERSLVSCGELMADSS